MSTTTADFVDVDACIIGEQFGPVARNDFERSDPSRRADLLDFAMSLRSMPDEEFLEQAAHVIYDCAAMARFDGFDHLEAKGSMCFAESDRRHQLSGHRTDCRVGTLYSQAHDKVTISHGHTPRTTGTCECTGITS